MSADFVSTVKYISKFCIKMMVIDTKFCRFACCESVLNGNPYMADTDLPEILHKVLTYTHRNVLLE